MVVLFPRIQMPLKKSVPGAVAPAASAYVARVLAAKSPRGLFTALWEISAAHAKLSLEELPEIPRLIRVVCYLKMSRALDGISGFLGEFAVPVGDYAHEAEAWCKRIRAQRTAEYLEGAAALFPEGRVPASPVMRFRHIEIIEDDAPKAFRALDRQYKDWPNDFAPAFQAYVAAHRAEVEGQIARAGGEGESRKSAGGLLAIDDPERFIDALVDELFPTGGVSVPLDERPELLQMLLVLRGLRNYTQADGIWNYLDQHGVGEHLARAEAWCRKIKATRAAAYFRAVEAAFPGKRVPANDDERSARLMELSERKPDPLEVLDRKYADTLEEMLVKLHVYLRAHPEEVEAGLAEHAAELTRAATSVAVAPKRGGGAPRKAARAEARPPRKGARR